MNEHREWRDALPSPSVRQSKVEKLLELQKSSIGTILTFGEAALPQDQFRAFKKLVLNHFHEFLKPKTISLIDERIDQVRAVPLRDNLGRKGGVQ